MRKITTHEIDLMNVWSIHEYAFFPSLTGYAQYTVKNAKKNAIQYAKHKISSFVFFRFK